MMRRKRLLYLGASIPIVFFGTTFICGYMQGNYNHFTRMVSELGTIGTKSQFVFMAGLLVCSILSVLFVVGLYKTCKETNLSVIPVALILLYSVSIAGAAIFPLPLRLHGILGMPSVLLILSPLMGLILWNKQKQLSDVVPMSTLSFLVMSLGFLTFMPDVLASYPGLKQRFFHVGWSIWFFYLSYGFVKLLDKRKGLELKTVSV
jgi:hypothetical membrane protein